MTGIIGADAQWNRLLVGVAVSRGGYIADAARLLCPIPGGYVGRHSSATSVKSGSRAQARKET